MKRKVARNVFTILYSLKHLSLLLPVMIKVIHKEKSLGYVLDCTNRRSYKAFLLLVRRHKLVFLANQAQVFTLAVFTRYLPTTIINCLDIASTLEKNKVYLKYSYTVKYLWLV